MSGLQVAGILRPAVAEAKRRPVGPRVKPSVRLDKMLAVLDALGLELEVKPRGEAIRPLEP